MTSCSKALLALFASITCAWGYRANSGHCTALNVSGVRNLESQAHRVHGHEDSASLAGPQHDIPLTAGAPLDGIFAGRPDQCKVEKKLGEGSFGVAHLVKCLDMGRVVQRVTPREKFVKDQLQPMNWDLPFIMPVLAVYYTAEEVSVFMPYFDAGLSFLDSPSKPSEFTKTQAAMIAWGLYNLHKAGFVHRDLKGANMMKDTSTGIMSLIDFGLVSKWPKQDGEPKGNQMYMSPERAARKWYGPETDWYAFGLLMFHAHAGKRLYHSSEMSGMQLRDAFTPDGLCARIRSDIPDVKLQDLILMLLANNDKGEHLYTDGESEDSIIAASKKYLDVETHPVLQHAYFTSDADKIDWSELPKVWPGFESGYCTKGPMNVRVKTIQQQCDEIDPRMAPCICDRPPELEECCCRGTPSYERGVSQAHRAHGHEDSEILAGPQHDIPLTARAPPDGICAGRPAQCEIEKKVGEGSFGVAHLVKCLDMGRVVQKVIPREKFVKEELQPMNLDLPFIMPVFAVYYTAEEVSVFMPYFDAGLSFLDFPSKPSVFTKTQAAMIAWGLYNLHKAGFVHRDLKGENMMKDTSTGIMSLIDFGLVSKWPKQDGEPKGNPMYMSPERAARKWYGPETDWYAFGLLMFHAHAGKRLYRSSEISGMQLRDAFTPDGGCARIKWDIPDVKLQDLILMLLANNDKGEHLYTDGESEDSIIAASKKYLDVETHPVLQHAYFTSGADKIDWSELPNDWPGYESGYCIKGPMNVRVRTIQQQCDEFGKGLAPCICDRPPELEECCCRGTPSYESGVL